MLFLRAMNDVGSRVIGGRYVLRDVLGAGGMGVVYRANDLEHDREVAVKLLHPRHRDAKFTAEHLLTEGRVGACVQHPNVVAVFDVGTSNGELFVVMEHLAGRLLGELLQCEGPLSLCKASSIVCQILAGLQALHDMGIVHGDVKTNNVIVTSSNGVDAIKLIDLDLVRALDEPESKSATERIASGTPDYMAPEVILGEGSRPASDIYATGVILYELLTGTTPFGGGTQGEILQRHLDDEVVPPSLRCSDRSIPPELERAIMVALEKAPCARHATARGFAEAIAAATPMLEPPAPPGGHSLAFSTTAPTADWQSTDLPARWLASGTHPAKS